jgi:AraC-like DNA-binding protein
MLAESFELYYKKDEIESGVLWENHCHAHFELIAVLTGDVCVSIEGKELRIAPGEALLVPPLCYHAVIAHKKCTYRRLTAAFDKEAIPLALQDALSAGGARPFAVEPNLADRLRILCNEKNTAFYAPLAGALMIQLLYACVAESKQPDADCADPLLHKALLYIEEHLCERLLLENIAASIPCSKSLLCHRFQQKMRVSPRQYILQKRMALAAKLIREGTPPTKAALRVGYENYSNFYRMYQKHLHGVPSDRIMGKI